MSPTRLAPPRWRIAALPFDIRILAEECRRAANHLNDCGIRGDGQRIGNVLWLDIVVRTKLYLHQLARTQRIVQGADQRWRQTLLSDMDQRIEMMRLGAKLRALSPLQFLILPCLVMKLRTSIGEPFQ